MAYNLGEKLRNLTFYRYISGKPITNRLTYQSSQPFEHIPQTTVLNKQEVSTQKIGIPSKILDAYLRGNGVIPQYRLGIKAELMLEYVSYGHMNEDHWEEIMQSGLSFPQATQSLKAMDAFHDRFSIPVHSYINKKPTDKEVLYEDYAFGAYAENRDIVLDSMRKIIRIMYGAELKNAKDFAMFFTSSYRIPNWQAQSIVSIFGTPWFVIKSEHMKPLIEKQWDILKRKSENNNRFKGNDYKRYREILDTIREGIKVELHTIIEADYSPIGKYEFTKEDTEEINKKVEQVLEIINPTFSKTG